MTSTATLFEYVAYPYEVAGRDSFSEGRLHLTEETLDRLDTLNETKDSWTSAGTPYGP